MKKIKFLFALVLSFSMIFALPAYALGTSNIQFSPRASSNVSSCTNSFDLNTKTGYAAYGAETAGVTNASKVTVAMVIQRRENGSWVNVSGTYMEASDKSNFVSIANARYVEKGYYYRLHSVHTATVGSTTSTELFDSNMVLYN